MDVENYAVKKLGAPLTKPIESFAQRTNEVGAVKIPSNSNEFPMGWKSLSYDRELKQKNIASVTPPLRKNWKYFNISNNSIRIPLPEKAKIHSDGKSTLVTIPVTSNQNNLEMQFIITSFKEKIDDFELFALNYCENLTNYKQDSVFKKSQSLKLFAINVCHNVAGSKIGSVNGDVYFLGVENNFYKVEPFYGYSPDAMALFITALLNAKSNNEIDIIKNTKYFLSLPLHAEEYDAEFNLETPSGKILTIIDGPYEWKGNAIDWTNEWCNLGGSVEREKYIRSDGMILTNISTLCSYAQNYLIQKDGKIWRIYAKQETTDYDTLWSLLAYVDFK